MTTHHESMTIVTHCYCPKVEGQANASERLDAYAQHLKWQAASLLRFQPAAQVVWTICYTMQDCKTVYMLARIGDLCKQVRPPRLRVTLMDLRPGQLFRRGFGRNQAALECTTDLIWFTDVDYLFGDGCIDAAVGEANELGEGSHEFLMMPGEMHINTSHDIGQAMIDDARNDDFPDIPVSQFTKRKQKICIGGCQIITGRTANRIGYCNNTEWSEPVEEEHGFRSCKCDVKFRKLANLTTVRLDIPNVFRIRHTVDGRDFDMQGAYGGKTVW